MLGFRASFPTYALMKFALTTHISLIIALLRQITLAHMFLAALLFVNIGDPREAVGRIDGLCEMNRFFLFLNGGKKGLRAHSSIRVIQRALGFGSEWTVEAASKHHSLLPCMRNGGEEKGRGERGSAQIRFIFLGPLFLLSTILLSYSSWSF